jgi:hypothetical protein
MLKMIWTVLKWYHSQARPGSYLLCTLMSSSKNVPCYCPKCNGMLVSIRTERNHRNGPAIRQIEAAERKPGRQKRRRTAASPAPSSDDNPELPNGHADTDGHGAVEEHALADIDMDIVMTDNNVKHFIHLSLFEYVFTN